MILLENLDKNSIILKPKSKNRWELIEEMVDLAIRNNDVAREDRDSIVKALVEREKSMSTGIGNGVAIPHCTTPRVKDVVIIMTISRDGIEFDSIDNQPVRIVILLLVPKNKLTQHIKTLANIAKMMSDDELREQILSLKTPDAIINAMKKHSGLA
jgi:fructose-specific phosphotransferase system IIA component